MLYNKYLLFNQKPPTLYSIMNSMVNYNNENKTKIKNLANYCHEQIFDFEYPLTSNIEKDEFEILILNKFLMRRIGYETFNAFQIALFVKLNEIMPRYNKMFDMLDGWSLFNAGEVQTRTLTESGTGTTTNEGTNVNVTKTKYAELPQNQLADLENGNYVTDYTVQNNNDSVENETINSQSNSLNETISRTPSDKLKIYNEFIENKNNIYTMIFKDLSCLFYGLI